MKYEVKTGTTLDEIEKQAILYELTLNGGNRIRTAKALGIGDRTLQRKLKRYGVRHTDRCFCKECRGKDV